MAFDPDAYLAKKKSSSGGFDPDAYLAKRKAAPAAPTDQPEQPSPYSAKNLFGAGVEPLASMATGAIATPIADVAGIISIPLHALGLTKTDPKTGLPVEPEEARRRVQEALTYHPRTGGGKTAQSAIAYPFEKYGQFAEWVGKKAGSESAYPSFGRGVAQTIKELPGLLGAKALKGTEAEAQAAKAMEKADPARVARAARDMAYNKLSPVPGQKVAEATRSEAMKLAEKTISDEAAKHGQIPGEYESIPHSIKPILDRDVPNDLAADVNSRVQNYNEAYQTFRNKLKDEWQQVARQKEASGQPFQQTEGAKTFVRKIDDMIKLYKSDRAVVSQLNSFKQMVMGGKEHVPTFDAIETAQQRIKAAAGDPTNARIPNLVADFKGISKSLDEAMGEYAPQYKDMLSKWSDIMNRKESLEKVSKFSEKYARELRSLSPTYAKDARTTFSETRRLIRHMEDDGLVDNATAQQYIKNIEEAEKVVTDNASAQKVAWTVLKVAMITTAGAIGLGKGMGWWGAQIAHQGARGE